MASSKKKKTEIKGRTHLIIPDSHSKPGSSNDRYTWLGKLCADRKPDVIVDIGDWADMESLCYYDKGKKSFEGRRYTADVMAARDAREKFNIPIDEFNKKTKGDKYNPRKVVCTGNHEVRIKRLCESTPELDGMLKIEDLGAEEYGWEVYDFMDPVIVDGIAYAHYFPSGVMNKAIGGEHPAASVIKKRFMSCTFGHTHIYDGPAIRSLPTGQKIMGLNVGCYFDHHESYAGEANKMWWRGVILKHITGHGTYDVEMISMERMKELYG